MNIYDVDIGDWTIRVKACSFSVAISRAVRSAKRRKMNIDGVSNDRCTVRAKIFQRNVDPKAPIPEFEEDKQG